jgi:hypothetical protein
MRTQRFPEWDDVELAPALCVAPERASIADEELKHVISFYTVAKDTYSYGAEKRGLLWPHKAAFFGGYPQALVVRQVRLHQLKAQLAEPISLRQGQEDKHLINTRRSKSHNIIANRLNVPIPLDVKGW